MPTELHHSLTKAGLQEASLAEEQNHFFAHFVNWPMNALPPLIFSTCAPTLQE